MPSKYLAIGLIVGLFIGLLMGYFLAQIFSSPSQFGEITNPKVISYAVEGGTSGWYKTMNITSGENSPVISQYYSDSGDYEPMPQTANLGVRVVNNNSESLFNMVVEVSYRTSEGKWNTTARIAIGFLDIQESKTVRMALANPYLSIWQTQEHVYNDPNTKYRNVTAYVLDASNYKIIAAYGYAKP